MLALLAMIATCAGRRFAARLPSRKRSPADGLLDDAAVDADAPTERQVTRHQSASARAVALAREHPASRREIEGARRR